MLAWGWSCGSWMTFTEGLKSCRATMASQWFMACIHVKVLLLCMWVCIGKYTILIIPVQCSHCVREILSAHWDLHQGSQEKGLSLQPNISLSVLPKLGYRMYVEHRMRGFDFLLPSWRPSAPETDGWPKGSWHKQGSAEQKRRFLRESWNVTVFFLFFFQRHIFMCFMFHMCQC